MPSLHPRTAFLPALLIGLLLPACGSDSPTAPGPTPAGTATVVPLSYSVRSFSESLCNGGGGDMDQDQKDYDNPDVVSLTGDSPSLVTEANHQRWFYESGLTDSTLATYRATTRWDQTFSFAQEGTEISGISGSVDGSVSTSVTWSGDPASRYGQSTARCEYYQYIRFRVGDEPVDLVLVQTSDYPTDKGWTQFEVDRMRDDDPTRSAEQLFGEEFYKGNEGTQTHVIRLEAGHVYELEVSAGLNHSRYAQFESGESAATMDQEYTITFRPAEDD
jgi:hypothetical protein